MAEGQKIRPLVRIFNTDLKGERPIRDTLRAIKGIGFMFSNLVLHLTKIDGNIKTGLLTDAQIEQINKVLKNPLSAGVPIWFFNRRKDYEEGTDIHLLTSDIAFVQSGDIKRAQATKSYTGMRHSWRLPVRGQRTSSNFRKNKGKGIAGKKKTTVRK